MKPQTFWQRLGRAVRDRSFVVGSVLVGLFVLVAVLGPEVAPYNPYLRDRVQTIDGELRRAPIPPCDLYPLGTDNEGRDMLTMLLHGARQTLVIAFVATTARLLLGSLLGSLAGWWPNSLFDRAVTALTEFVSAIPGLVLAILLVFAVGIKRGQVSFIAALSLVGLGEVAQIVRGSVMGIRNKLYILAARALGLGPAQVLSRHVLPNLLSTLLALAALEMGAVLLLLGELGFVRVFVGGGGLYEDDAIGLIHYFDVPDWGAMLGTSWRYFRSLPWLPMAPALAFFVVILGFNLFGYGLQRFIEKGRFHPNGWSLLAFFMITVLVLFGARALLASTGIEAQYIDLARQFDVQRARDDIAYLAQPEEGTVDPDRAVHVVDYIADQFEQAGLTDLTTGTYLQPYVATRGQITDVPSLELLGVDGGSRLQFDSGVTFDPLQPFVVRRTDCGPSCREDELVVLGNAQGGVRASGVILLLDPMEVLQASWSGGASPYSAILRLVPDDELWRTDRAPSFYASTYVSPIPELLIGESVARELLSEAGLDLNKLRRSLDAQERINVPTGLRVRVKAGLTYEQVATANVVGYFPAADRETEGDRILVSSLYSGPPLQEGVVSSGVVDNASGVAVMMEVARLWRDLDFEPKRTVVFAAFNDGGGQHFAHYPILPVSVSDTWTAVTLQEVGNSVSSLARREAGTGLARAFDQSAHRFGQGPGELEKWQFFFTTGSDRLDYVSSDQSYSGLAVVWPEDATSNTLAETGKTVAHYLMVLSSR